MFLPFFAGDVIGKILAWFSLLPMFIVIGFITLIMFRREIHTVQYVVYCYFIYVGFLVIPSDPEEPLANFKVIDV